jgi:GT2 family glycosyltransferase
VTPAAERRPTPDLEPGVDPDPQTDPSRPLLSGIVVHWGDREPLDELLAAWPGDPRFELVVVDNAGTEELALPPGCRGRVLRPDANLGFAGGVNAGVAAARADRLLILNSDVVPRPGALKSLVRGFEETFHGGIDDRIDLRTDGLIPRLEDPGGTSQWRWQLRDLPSPAALLLHALFVPAGGRRPEEPKAGEPVEQPAAAALALTREAFESVGGLDEGFHPAWFEDVDLARRLRAEDRVLRYFPAARFRHRLGSSVASLGYGQFLWIYSRNLVRYLEIHHGGGWALTARALLPLGALLRLLALPLRRPRRAASRREAAAGLTAAALGALSGWRLPARWAKRWTPRRSQKMQGDRLGEQQDERRSEREKKPREGVAR